MAVRGTAPDVLGKPGDMGVTRKGFAGTFQATRFFCKSDCIEG